MKYMDLNFVTAGILSDLKTYIAEWDRIGNDYDWPRDKPKLLKRILITPSRISLNSKTIDTILDLKDKGEIEEVMFDSGGYQLHKNNSKYTFEELLDANTQLYKQYDWADVYFLQDDAPVNGSTFKQINKCVEHSIEASLELFNRLPENIQKKSSPVLQAMNLEHIDLQLEKYKDLLSVSEPKLLGYARIITPNLLGNSNLRFLNSLIIVDRINKMGYKTHYLGIGSTSLIFLLRYLNMQIESYDNSSWIQAAGFGTCIFPYGNRFLTSKQPAKRLDELREKTGHRCPFCERFEDVRDSRTSRFMHNLVVYNELNEIYEEDKMDLEKFKKDCLEHFLLLSEFQNRNAMPLFANL